MSNPYFCHFCGRSDSLHNLPDTNSQVCSKCWEIIAHIAAKFFEVLMNQAIPTSDEIVLSFLRKKLENKISEDN